MKLPGWIDSIRIFLSQRYNSGYGSMASENGIMERREKVTVFIVSIIIALVMWFVVSLGKDLSMTVEFNLTVGQMPDNMALASDLPKVVSASVTGEGWRLLSLNNNPQTIAIDVNQEEILLADMIREKISATGVIVLSVQPAILRTVLEERIEKKVPIYVDHSLTYRGQYGLVGSLRTVPDSIVVSGARSIVDTIDTWITEKLTLNNVNAPIEEVVALRPPATNIRLSADQITVVAHVSEYTEGEQRVRIIATDIPEGMDVSFNPPYISIRFSVPIDEYAHAQSAPLFSAEVPYVDINNDSTGYVSPIVTNLGDSLHATVRIIQPRRVSYFKIIR